MPKLTPSQRIDLAAQALAAQARGAAAFRKADELVEKLVAGGCQPEEIISLPDGGQARIVDQFQQAKVFKTVCLARWKLERGEQPRRGAR
jgi:hypothetical protein